MRGSSLTVATLPSFPLLEGSEDKIPSRRFLFRGSLLTSWETHGDWGVGELESQSGGFSGMRFNPESEGSGARTQTWESIG